MRILDVTYGIIEKMILGMSKKGVQARRINVAVQAVRVPASHFCKMHRIPNTMAGLEKLKENPKQRGILSFAEVSKLIAVEGEELWVKAVLLGALCGLRMGEVRSLQWADIDETTGSIKICHNL